MTSNNDDSDINLLDQSNILISGGGVEESNNEFSMHNGDPQSLKLPFDLSSLDPSDPLNFLMPNAGVNEPSGPGSVSGDSSSMEDTNSSVSSTHGSPGAWPAVWNGNEDDSLNLGYSQYGGTPPEVNEQPKWPTNSDTQAIFDALNTNSSVGNLGMDIDFDPSSLPFSSFCPFSSASSFSSSSSYSANQQTLLSPMLRSRPKNNCRHANFEVYSFVGQRSGFRELIVIR